MQILLASAKIMRERCHSAGIEVTHPMFGDVASKFAGDLARMTVDEIADAFACSRKIAELNIERYKIFGSDEAELVPAVFAYYGQAYKHLKADEFSVEELEWACSHLWISSCMYGLLRPSDVINQYRMDGSFILPSSGGVKVADFWKSRLTDILIDSVLADDGILVYLDTDEYRALFDWKRVLSSVSVIEPEFHILKEGRLTTPAVWAKTCRGAMTRYIIENRLTRVEQLNAFCANEFHYDACLSNADRPVFVRGFGTSDGKVRIHPHR
ncbi:MAG: YaaA family protein [Rikenellaceae bacterium]|nr:YaaA family protein [Rikenellaceae bacterium]MDY3730233.1 YaaA family protein [Candidatus Choladocola sp.]